jgi:hypothetical protein
MKISQREARRLQRRVEELEAQERRRRNAWLQDWPGGAHILTLNQPDELAGGGCLIARKLGHAVVVVPSDDLRELRLYALPLGDRP